MEGSKGQSVHLTIRVIFILECVNNNEDTKLFNPTFTLKCSFKHAYSLTIFPHIGKFVQLIGITIKIQGKDTACKTGN